EPHARIEHCVEDVGYEIEDDDERGVKDYDAEYERIVASDCAFDEIAADPGYAENALDHEGAREQPRKSRSEIADERQKRPGKRMTHHDESVRQALGSRGAHEIRAQHFHHAGAHQARNNR